MARVARRHRRPPHHTTEPTILAPRRQRRLDANQHAISAARARWVEQYDRVVDDHAPPQNFEFREGTFADLDVVLDLLNESAQWLLDRGIRQWFAPFPRPLIEKDLVEHRVFLALRGVDVLATGTALTADPMFWGDQPPGSWYIHRLARRRNAHPGVGRTLLAWIEDCARNERVARVRLDCSAALGSYYERSGYTQQWAMTLLGSSSTSSRSLWLCYEKTL